MNETNSMIFTLTFDLAGGSGTYEDVTAQASSYYQIPSASPFRAGYCFMGWRNCADEIFLPGQDYWFNYGNDTLVAVWEPIGLTLTFDTNGSMDVYPPITGLETESIVLGNLPTRQGYYFSRWENSWGISFNAGDTYTFNYGNDTLTAKWCSVTAFDLDGGEGSFPDISGEEMTNTLIPEALPTKAGYSFVKWSSTKYGDMNPGDPYFFTGNDTLTAVWETAWYTLTYDLNQADAPESIESQEGQATTNVLLSETVPAREGYTFVRWENTAGEKFQPGDPYFFGYHDDTLTAVWGYTVTLNANGGECVTEVKGGVGETLDLVPTRDGYTFMGWERPNGSLYNDESPYTFVFGHDSLTAIWGYTVSYTHTGDTVIEPQKYFLNTSAAIHSAPSRSGYNFDGWYDEEENNCYAPDSTHTFEKDVTLTAHWSCGVVFDYNEGSGDYYLLTSSEGGLCTLPTATREGYTFIKWVGSNGNEYTANDTYYFIYGNDTLTAVWECTVCFETNGAEESLDSITKGSDESITLPLVVKEGYDLVGWTNSKGIDFAPDGTYSFVYGNDTLTAIWEVKTYTVTYNVEGFADQTKEYFTSVTLHSSVPTMEGYTFLNWEGDNGSYYDAGEEYTVNGDLSLTAVWVENGKTVITYDLSGGTGEFPKQTKGEGESITLHSGKPTADGVGFYRWVDQNGNTYEEGAAYSGSESLKLTAVWKPVYTITYLGAGGVVYTVQEKLEDEIVKLLDYVPTKSNHEFVHWLVIGADGVYEPEDDFALNCNVTLKPLWREIYIVAYSNGNRIEYFDEKPSGESLTVRENTFANEGYTFVCWQWDNRNEYYFPGDTFTNDEEGAFRPVWVETTKKKIVYDIGDAEGDFSAQEADKDQDIVISDEVPIKEGCVFNGWIVIPCDEEDSIEPMQAYSLASVSNVADSTNTIVDGRYVGRSSAVLKADMRGTYTVSFCDKYGAVIHTQQKNYGEDITLWSTTPTMSSYEFVCWIDEESGAMYMPGDQFFKNRNTTLISKWTYATDFIGIEIFNKPENMTVYVGVPHRLNVIANPMNLVVSSTWSSSNEAVATVDENGVVTPRSLGTTTITVTSTYNANGASETFEDSVNLFVKHVFEFAEGVSIDDADVREKALTKMNVYYKNEEIAEVVDGRDPECDTCIFAFEGLGDPSLKEQDEEVRNVSAEHPIWLYNAMMVVTKSNKITYVTRRASTLPDDATGPNDKDEYGHTIGPTTLKEGIYGYRTGNHGGKYIGMRPTDDPRKSWYYKNGEFYCADSEVTNLHAGNSYFYSSDNNSEGCQLIHYKDYVSFGKAVGFLKAVDINGDEKCEVANITEIDGKFGTYIGSIIGTVDEKLDCNHIHSNILTIKYIIDRSYDQTNNFYADQTKFDEFSKKLLELKQIDKLSTEQEKQKKDLTRYLDYNDQVGNKYKSGIFYPISNECNKDI